MEKIEEAVKDEREFVLAIARRITPADSPVAFNSQIQQQQPFPTPSPFSFSVASTGWSSRSSIHHHSTLLLRFSVLLFSFISALILAAPSTKKKHQPSPSFTDYPELIYCFIVASIAFLYTALQLFKGVCDIAHRGILISDMALDYLVGYLLVSSASVAVPIIGLVERGTPLRKGAVVSTSMAFATFIVMAVCAILSGYKLCKRIGW
ncbi:UDP-D-glucose/UDP-D-galactose 4-epimerase 1 isoform 1 [Hibiscus syriacus]|uniref:CASP-like protein n=1 Tax=Hibiscus syriacus TaxID=106335 RepID=A0A6A2Y292_HIBSY|nr:UDP-D-glucose/UDP-D-galactose 4-epimerase 1 isoform 1 [Hibiscus syriacus]